MIKTVYRFLCFVFLFYSVIVLFTAVFVSVPKNGLTFIGAAKQYYFEGSDTGEKAQFFDSYLYKYCWQKVDGVDKVLTGQDLKRACPHDGVSIWAVEAKGAQIYVSEYDEATENGKTMRKMLNEVSDIAWGEMFMRVVGEFWIWIFSLVGLIFMGNKVLGKKV